MGLLACADGEPALFWDELNHNIAPWPASEPATQSARIRALEGLFERWVAGSSPAMVIKGEPGA
jgi:hypothetical protein